MVVHSRTSGKGWEPTGTGGEYYLTTQQETYDNVTCQTAVLHEFSAGMKSRPQFDLPTPMSVPPPFFPSTYTTATSSSSFLFNNIDYIPTAAFSLSIYVPCFLSLYWSCEYFIPSLSQCSLCLHVVSVCIRKLFIHATRRTWSLHR